MKTILAMPLELAKVEAQIAADALLTPGYVTLRKAQIDATPLADLLRQ